MDDPDLLHRRVVLLCESGNRALVVTPDRDVQDTVLEVGKVYSEVRRMEVGRLPRGVRERATYLAKHSEQGEFTTEELRALALEAREQGFEVAPLRRLGEKTPPFLVDAAGTKQAAPEPEVPLDKILLCVYSTSGKLLGEEVPPPPDAATVKVGGKTLRIFSLAGDVLVCQYVDVYEVSSMTAFFKRSVDKDQAVDLRVLPVLYDGAEERWRTLAEAVPEYEEIDFDDFPMSGPRTLLRDVKQLRRQSMDFMMHHESWVKKSGVRSSDRSVYEHMSLCRALHFMVSYDQLNVVSLASAEALNRRRTLIELAHQGRPELPSYEGSEEILGVREAADGSIIDPALTSHAAKRQAAKAEVLKQKRLAAEEKRYSKRIHEDEDDDGKSKGKGRGRGQKPQTDP